MGGLAPARGLSRVPAYFFLIDGRGRYPAAGPRGAPLRRDKAGIAEGARSAKSSHLGSALNPEPERRAHIAAIPNAGGYAWAVGLSALVFRIANE